MRRAMARSSEGSGHPNPSSKVRSWVRAAGPFDIWHPNRRSIQLQASPSLRRSRERMDTGALSRRAYRAES